MEWRVIVTDSESETGIAPVCHSAGHPPEQDLWVFNCCPHPHLELGTPDLARRTAREFTDADAAPCS